MSLQHIKATCDCDYCGKMFHVLLDPAHTFKQDTCIDDYINDIILGGQTGYGGLVNGPTLYNKTHLCSKCTATADAWQEAQGFPDEYQLSADQLAEALAERNS